MQVNSQRVIDFMAAQIAEQSKTIANLQAQLEFLEMQLKNAAVNNSELVRTER